MLDQNAKRNPLIPKVIYMEGHDPNTNVVVEVAINYNDFLQRTYLFLRK